MCLSHLHLSVLYFLVNYIEHPTYVTMVCYYIINGFTGGDEFVTAMLEAERLDIPVRLGDAPQTDTLNSIKNVMSAEVFDPLKVVQGASLLVSRRQLCTSTILFLFHT